jgi:hypothetical protein
LRASWTPDEVKQIITVIENEDVEDYFLGLIMKNIDKSETLTLADIKKEMGWK